VFRILSVALVLSVALLGSAQAKDKKEKVTKTKKVKEHVKIDKKVHTRIAKVKKKETIKIHTKGKHDSLALVEKGKIRSVVVKRGEKDVKVTKFRSSVRLHAALPGADGYQFISTAAVASVGFGYIDEDDENKLVVMWFAPDQVEGGDDGAEDLPADE